MKELVEVIAKALVEHPEEVTVRERQEGRITKVDLYVAPSDMGKVIGRQGRIAKSIRAVVKAAATREDAVVDVNIDSTDMLKADEAEAASAQSTTQEAADSAEDTAAETDGSAGDEQTGSGTGGDL